MLAGKKCTKESIAQMSRMANSTVEPLGGRPASDRCGRRTIAQRTMRRGQAWMALAASR